MYQINDVVVYGLHGVCRITEIEDREFAGDMQPYYTMRPVFDNRSTFFVPVNNEKSQKKIRKLLTTQEIGELIRSVPQLEKVKVPNEKHRKETYKGIVESGDRIAIMGLIKTIHLRQEAQFKAGKKQHLIDERFLKEAETILYDEFAFVLNIERDNVAAYIKTKLESI